MKFRALASIGVLALVSAVVSLTPVTVAEASSEGAQAPTPTAAGKTCGLSRTPDGQPDLQGMWTNATITPFERPSNLAGKPFLTEKETAELEKQAAKQRTDADGVPRTGDVGNYNQFWFDSGTKVVSTRQTSLVVDPPDGRVPVTRAAEERRDATLARDGDSYEYMSPWDRCITRGAPGSMFPAGYNNAYQIL